LISTGCIPTGWYYLGMSLRAPAALALGIGLIVLPVLIVRAQVEGETEAPLAAESVVEAAPVAPEEAEAATESEQEEGVGSAEATPTDASATSSDPGAAGNESVAPAAESDAASTTAPDLLTLDIASSTASSTEAVAESPAVEPKEESFVLQPAVALHVDGSSLSADIQLENLTCKSCAKVLPAAEVKAYYTAWYPNDGDIREVGDRIAERAIEVSDVALWTSRSMAWSAADIAPGRYYFVVLVDPENAIGAYQMQRMEFVI